MMEKYSYRKDQLDIIESLCIPFAIYQFVDKRVVTIAISDGFCELYQMKDKEEAYYLMDNDMYRDIHPDDRARVADAAVLFATDDVPYDVVYRILIGGKYRIIHAFGRHIYTEEGVRLATVWYNDEGEFVEDGEDRGALNRAFTDELIKSSKFHRMNYDYLTGLPSMTYFFELSEAARKHIEKMNEIPAMLYFDLSGMKSFNQKYGFLEGDKLLIEFSKLLSRVFGNDSCSRLGQDHFAAVSIMEGIEERVQTVIDDVKKLNEGRTLPVRIGIYHNDLELVVAPTACDRAKYACDIERNAYYSYYKIYDASMLEKNSLHQYVIDNIDKAIEERWIQVWYQPIVRAANGRVCDEEALSRWIDPVKGFMSPAEFIPALEETKLIYKLDLFVIDEVLRRMKRQKDDGLYVVPISINLSRSDFETCDIVEEICKRIDAVGIPRNKLTIEITESIIGRDFDFMKDQIDRFREQGFQVWMDDFGSGYSSLDVLEKARFDLVKLDMGLIQQLGKSYKSGIIVSELIKLAISLGVETVAEGVEDIEQAEFLRTVGCTKLQGYYYCKPISYENIIERYKEGKQIGFENPDEADYYTSIGRVNLYDLSIVSNEEIDDLQNYFETSPMAVIAVNDSGAIITRGNVSFWDFMERTFPLIDSKMVVPFVGLTTRLGSAIMGAVKKCSDDGNVVFIEEENDEGSVIHAFVRRIAVNPVTGERAVVLVILGISERDKQTLTYAHIAQALSADYTYLYYVNLETEDFIEYRSDPEKRDLAVERHGKNFFEASRKDAEQAIYEADRDFFISEFNKENLVESMENHGTFTFSYRLMVNGYPVYVNLKAVPMDGDDKHVIIGVNNVDAQMRKQEAMEKMEAELITYSRIAALLGDFICIYIVDPEDDTYLEYSATGDYEGLGLAKSGDDFFNRALIEADTKIYFEDRDRFKAKFIKEKVMEGIRKNGAYSIEYRLMINDKPVDIRLKAALVEENNGPQLIIGVTTNNKE